MATYIPNATQTTEPVESRTVESAALEFRTLKTSINERIEDVQDGLDAEVVNRIAGDANLQTQNNAQDVRLTVIENALPFIGEGVVPGTVYVQRFSGTGVQTAFTLDVVPHAGNVVDIYVNGLYQNKDTFTVSGAVITFSEAPPAGTNNIEVQVTVTIALGETDASLVTYGGTTVAAQLDAFAQLAASETVSGLVELADAAEAQALASAVVALTPARLADALKGANQSLAGNGYQKLPGGLIIQWGVANLSSNLVPPIGTSVIGSITFPIAFPTGPFSASLAGFVPNSTGVEAIENFFSIEMLSATTLSVTATRVLGAGATNENPSVAWIAIGY